LKLIEAEKRKQEEAIKRAGELMEAKAKSAEVGFEMFCDEFVDTHLRHLSIYH
jgi:hypothetical protein